MSHPTPSNHWTIGRDPACDVVVVMPGVASRHATLERQPAGFRLSPHGGKVGFATNERGGIHWTEQPRPIDPQDAVWLAPDVRLPWPSVEGSVAVLSVGRATDCDVVLEHPAVSGRHGLLVVGPAGTVVLSDQGSRNGIFLKPDREQRVQAVLLQPGSDIYLGMHRVATDELCRIAAKHHRKPNIEPPPVPPTIAPDVAPPPTAPADTPITSDSFGVLSAKSVPAAAAVIAVTTLCVMLLWIFIFRSPRNPANVHSAATTPAASPERADPASAVPPDPLAAQTAPAVADLSRPAIEASPKQAEFDVGRGVVWITVRRGDSDVRYRLGSGVAVESDTVLTTGSILVSAQSMLADGYSDLRVITIDGQHDREVKQHSVWKVFEERSAQAQQLSKTHQQLVENEAAPEVIEQSLQNVNLAFAAASAVDLGRMVCEPLPTHVELEKSPEFWPRRAVSIRPTGLDAEDPRLPNHFRTLSKRSAVTFRVQQTAATVDQVAGAITLVGPPSNAENWIGVPCFNGHRLEGIVTFQADLPESPETTSSPTLSLEIVSAETIRASLQ